MVNELLINEPSQDEILDRAKYYYEMSLANIHQLIRYKMLPYDYCNSSIRVDLQSSARSYTRNALTKSESILFLLAITKPDYEAIKAIPERDLPLYINVKFPYPDVEDFFKKRLKKS
jgi:hypothetical protein